MSKSRGDVLTEAVDLVDLPQLIEERYPQSGARAGQGGTIFASWRGNENTKAVSLTKKQRWLWHDFATDEGGSAYDWLTMVEGMGGQEAAHFLIERVGLASAASPEGRKQASEDKAAHRYRPLPTEATEALAALPVGTVPVMRNRGFTPKLLEHYGIKADGEDALIPITSPEGLVVQVKRRLANVEGSGKYRYEHKGYGGPAWCSLGLRKAKLIFVIEGECFPGDAEVLTPSGWQRLDAYDGSPVMQHNDDGSGEFVLPSAYIHKPFDGELIEWRSKGFASITTPGHRLIAYDRRGDLVEAPADQGHKRHYTIPRTVSADGPGLALSDDEIALFLAVSADGSISAPGQQRPPRTIRLSVSKQRKVRRLTGILDRLGVDYQVATYPSKPDMRVFWFRLPEALPLTKSLPWGWLAEMSSAQREFVLAELVHWDGNYVPNRSQTEYSSKHHHDASWVQALAHTTGRVSTIIPRSNRLGSWFKVSILHGKSTSSWQSLRRTDRAYRGDVYCVQVPSGRILVRQEDRVTVTGNCNAIIAHAALEHAGLTDIGVMGMAGAASPLYPGVVSNKAVYIYADDDEAGHKAKAVWAKAAHDEGARSVYETVSHSMDFCEYAGSQGKHALEALAAMLVALRDSATQVYGAVDRVIGGNQSIREIIEETRQLAEGKVIHTTGFSDVDRATGGIREAGLYGVAGLSAMGKSVAIRRMLLANLRDSDKSVRVYSPDQGDKSMWRLIASQLSGVSWSDEVRSGNYSKDSLALYGSPKDAKEAWFETYQDVLIHISPRFQVSPERHMGAIAKDMERAVAEGVTMFAADYLQVMTPSLGDKDGDQADEMQALSMRLGVPVLVALQLAKSKYPPTRVSGIPVPSDIEGSGAYYQSAEMMFMVYNEGVYGSKYAGDRWQPENDPVNMARLRIVKDKEGSGDGEWPMSWWPRLATYTDYIAGSPTYDVKRERKGLLPT